MNDVAKKEELKECEGCGEPFKADELDSEYGYCPDCLEVREKLNHEQEEDENI